MEGPTANLGSGGAEIDCVCVCGGIYFDVYASKCVPGGEQEVGLATRTRRITGSPQLVGKHKEYTYISYILHMYVYAHHKYMFHIYILSIYTHTHKENKYICVYLFL